MPPSVDPSSSSDPKLPRSTSRRRSSPGNEWAAIDRAERWRPLVAMIVLVALLGAAVALIVAGLKR